MNHNKKTVNDKGSMEMERNQVPAAFFIIIWYDISDSCLSLQNRYRF